jgi:hypothetical protein
MGRYDDAPVIAADGRVLYAPNPRDLVTLVTPEPAPGDGLLYLGGSWTDYPRWPSYDLVVTVCGRREGWAPPPSKRHLQRPMRDDADVDWLYVEDNVEEVVETVESGGTALVRCYTGQNRSGLVTALAMRRLYGMTGDEAVEHLRALRSPTVLCNPVFEQYVRTAH